MALMHQEGPGFPPDKDNNPELLGSGAPTLEATEQQDVPEADTRIHSTTVNEAVQPPDLEPFPAPVTPESNRRKIVAVTSAAFLLAAGVFLGSKMGGDEEPRRIDPITGETVEAGSGQPTNEETDTVVEPELLVNNLCDTFTPMMASTALGLPETSITARQCMSSIEQGINIEIDYHTDAGVSLSALLMDDVIVGRNSVRNSDGSLSGFGDFEDYSTFQATRTFTIRTIDGREYRGALNSQSLRVRVEEHVLNIMIGASEFGSEQQPMSGPSINSQNEAEYRHLAKQLVERVFEVQA